jgi:hypothetical protein
MTLLLYAEEYTKRNYSLWTFLHPTSFSLVGPTSFLVTKWRAQYKKSNFTPVVMIAVVLNNNYLTCVYVCVSIYIHAQMSIPSFGTLLHTAISHRTGYPLLSCFFQIMLPDGSIRKFRLCSNNIFIIVTLLTWYYSNWWRENLLKCSLEKADVHSLNNRFLTFYVRYLCLHFLNCTSHQYNINCHENIRQSSYCVLNFNNIFLS